MRALCPSPDHKMKLILRRASLPAQPTLAQLEEYAAQRTLVVINPFDPQEER